MSLANIINAAFAAAVAAFRNSAEFTGLTKLQDVEVTDLQGKLAMLLGDSRRQLYDAQGNLVVDFGMNGQATFNGNKIAAGNSVIDLGNHNNLDQSRGALQLLSITRVADPREGLIGYNYATHKPAHYNGSVWVDLG
jgi:hypothetical protein